jgi:hypothetical protein
MNSTPKDGIMQDTNTNITQDAASQTSKMRVVKLGIGESITGVMTGSGPLVSVHDKSGGNIMLDTVLMDLGSETVMLIASPSMIFQIDAFMRGIMSSSFNEVGLDQRHNSGVAEWIKRPMMILSKSDDAFTYRGQRVARMSIKPILQHQPTPDLVQSSSPPSSPASDGQVAPDAPPLFSPFPVESLAHRGKSIVRWSSGAVRVDLAAIAEECSRAIMKRPRDGSPPMVALSADVLRAVAEHALNLSCDIAAVRSSSEAAHCAEIAARGPIVAGEGAADALGSVIHTIHVSAVRPGSSW